MASKLKQIPESLLVRLWRERATRQGSFRAGDGRRFRVIYPGRVGTTAGPDLRDAVLQEEGVGLVRGDVEVHVNQKDWDAHGHARDPRYNGVMLHVVGRMDGPYTTLHSGQRVPVLSLEHILDGEASQDDGTDPWQLLAHHGYSKPDDPAELAQLLDECGDARFLGSSADFEALLNEEQADQVLYAALMEALGYSQNRGPFRELAYLVSYRRLEAIALALPLGDRHRAIRDELLAAAGLLGGRSGGIGTGSGRWHTFRVRPQNHPRRRIAQFARVMDRFLPTAYAAYGLNLQYAVEPDTLDGTGRSNGTALGASRRDPEDRAETQGGNLAEIPPWAHSGLVRGMSFLLRSSCIPNRVGRPWRPLELALTGTLGKSSGLRERAGVGPGRARDMVANCILPFFHALAQWQGDSQLVRISLEVYRSLPRLQENELTREMLSLLTSGMARDDGDSGCRASQDKDELAGVMCSARRQQGLIHLHELLVSLPRSGSVRQV